MLARIAALLRIQPPVVDNRGLLFGSGASYPTIGSDGWQTGAVWCSTDGAAGTSLYVNEGSVTSANFVAVDTTAGASAGAIGFDDDVTGPLIYIETDTPTNDSYLTPFLITGAYANVADNAIVLSSSNPRPVSFLFEDSGSDLSSTNARAVLSRVLLTVDQSGSTINAIRGQIKCLDLVDVTTGIYAPVQGYLELAGTHISKTGATLSCFSASLEITTALTINSGGEAAGIHVETTGAGTITVDGGGTCAGILIDKASGAANWPVGISVLNSINGISLSVTTQASSMTVTALPADARAARFVYTCATPAMTDGYGAQEIDLTVTGTATGKTAATSTWINIGGSATLVDYNHVHTDGIWDGGATLTAAYISWAKYQCLLQSDPAWCSLWELNFDGANSEVDSLFNVNSMILSLGYQAGTPTKAAVGSIPFCSEAGGQLRYIYLYDAPDSD